MKVTRGKVGVKRTHLVVPYHVLEGQRIGCRLHVLALCVPVHIQWPHIGPTAILARCNPHARCTEVTVAGISRVEAHIVVVVGGRVKVMELLWCICWRACQHACSFIAVSGCIVPIPMSWVRDISQSTSTFIVSIFKLRCIHCEIFNGSKSKDNFGKDRLPGFRLLWALLLMRDRNRVLLTWSYTYAHGHVCTHT